MTWSTREIADLAGTSLRSVRHYHQVGLLPEPERRSNGYKQYGVTHLIRLLRIKRLVDLGFGLPQIAELGDRDEHPEDALRALDADLAAQIERLQRARLEVAEILEQHRPTDLPADLAFVGKLSLSASDRSLTSVMGRILTEDDRSTYAALLDDDVRTQSDDDFDVLPADADEATRQELAERMADNLRMLRERFPRLAELGASDPQRYRETVQKVTEEIYNPAQVDVMRRMTALDRKAGRPGTAD